MDSHNDERSGRDHYDGGIVITLSLIGGNIDAKAAGCEAIGNVRFIRDQLGPEDLAAVPWSDWVLASGMAANRAIRLINLRDKGTTVHFLGAPTDDDHLFQLMVCSLEGVC